MEPTGQSGLVSQGSSITGQHEKRGLESVLGVLLMPQHAAADVQHHRPVAANEGGEGDFIAAVGESVQQLFVALLVAALQGQLAAKMADAGCQCGTTHDCDSEWRAAGVCLRET